MTENKRKTPKDRLSKEFPSFTETQLNKLVEAYFILNWVNPSINIAAYIFILHYQE